MMTVPSTSQNTAGQPEINIPEGTFGPVTQTDIVRFAGAGGDFNPLHHDSEFAQQSGFDTPIAMGQFTAALLSAWHTDWCGVENLRAFSVQFKAPVNIGDTISFAATVREQHAEPDRPGWHRASLELTAKVKDQNAVLGSAEISVSGETLGLDETGEQRKPLWVPSAHRAEGSEMYTFQRWLKEHRGVSTTDYSSLHDWSVTEVGDFWGA